MRARIEVDPVLATWRYCENTWSKTVANPQPLIFEVFQESSDPENNTIVKTSMESEWMQQTIAQFRVVNSSFNNQMSIVAKHRRGMLLASHHLSLLGISFRVLDAGFVLKGRRGNKNPKPSAKNTNSRTAKRK